MVTMLLSGAALGCLSVVLWGLVVSRKQIKEDVGTFLASIHNLFTKEREAC